VIIVEELLKEISEFEKKEVSPQEVEVLFNKIIDYVDAQKYPYLSYITSLPVYNLLDSAEIIAKKDMNTYKVKKDIIDNERLFLWNNEL